MHKHFIIIKAHKFTVPNTNIICKIKGGKGEGAGKERRGERGGNYNGLSAFRPYNTFASIFVCRASGTRKTTSSGQTISEQSRHVCNVLSPIEVANEIALAN